MKYLKKYIKFQESIIINLENQSINDLLESLNLWHDSLLNSVQAEEVDMFDTFKLPTIDFNDKLDIDLLSDNIEFINSLASIALRKSDVNRSDDFATFLNKPCKFMFIFDINSNELENPQYLLFQTWNDTIKKWDDTKLYKVKSDIKKFYDKLTSKTLEIVDGAQNYIYSTSNRNEYILQNSEQETEIFRKVLRKEELEDLLKGRSVKINII